MNEQAARRWQIAQPALAAYAAQPKVGAVMLAGSVARGTADEYSDIEIDVFWNETPTEDDLQAAIEQSGGHLLYRASDENEWADGILLEGIKIDTSQFLSATAERWLHEVVDLADLEVEKHLLLAAIQHGHATYGNDLIEHWRQKAASYPTALAHAVIGEYLQFRPRFLLDMLASRNDTLFLQHGMVQVSQRIMGVLLGLNRQYLAHPHHKWLDWQIAQFTITPPQLAERLHGALRGEQHAGVNELHQLIEEVFVLVETHLPDFDTTSARAEFAEQRH